MLINDADRWRRRAEEARALAEQLNGYQARMAMLSVADDYDKSPGEPKDAQAPTSVPIDKLNARNKSRAVNTILVGNSPAFDKGDGIWAHPRRDGKFWRADRGQDENRRGL